ncbi:MAG: helix-turn-helix domain-containing protein [Chloroflexota bacterium]|nr:helix-turn-helix domain-containing protein [Chloroflexota bacterium]
MFAQATWASSRRRSPLMPRTIAKHGPSHTWSGMILVSMRPEELIRDARKRAGLSQTVLAQRAQTSQPAIARYESGAALPSLATLERILRVCGASARIGSAARMDRSASRAGEKLTILKRSRRRILSIARHHGVRSVRVFGSVARGEDDPRSDIDLLVELDADRTLLDLIGFQQQTADILGLPVDASAPRFMKPKVRKRALAEARPI